MSDTSERNNKSERKDTSDTGEKPMIPDLGPGTSDTSNACDTYVDEYTLDAPITNTYKFGYYTLIRFIYTIFYSVYNYIHNFPAFHLFCHYSNLIVVFTHQFCIRYIEIWKYLFSTHIQELYMTFPFRCYKTKWLNTIPYIFKLKLEKWETTHQQQTKWRVVGGWSHSKTIRLWKEVYHLIT